MGWAAGFQAGSQVARNALDAYYGAKERRETEELNQQAPETYEGVSPQNQQFLKNIQGAQTGLGPVPEGQTPLPTEQPAYQTRETAPGVYGLSVRNAEGGYTPVEGPGINTREQRVKYLGRDYSADQFNPDVQRAAKTQALADIVSKYRPAEGVRLGLEAQKAADEAEARRYGVSQRPMAERLTAAQVGAAEAQTSGLQRGEAQAATLEKAESALGEAVNTPNFDFKTWFATQNLSPTVGAALQKKVNELGLAQVAGDAIKSDLKYNEFQARLEAAEKQGIKVNPLALAREMGLSTAGKTKYFQDQYGVTDAELKANQKYLESKLAGVKNLEGLRELHKNDPNFDPGQHFDFTEGPDGKITVRMYDSNTNEPLANVAPRVYKNRDDALASLVAEAKGADSLIAYTATKRKTDLEERWKEAQIKGEDAKTEFVNEQRKGLPAQALVWTEQANHLKAQTAVIPAESEAKIGSLNAQRDVNKAEAAAIPGKTQAQIGLMGAQAANARSGAALHDAQTKDLDKVKASNLMPLTNDVTGDVILVDATKLERNANGSLAIPNGYKPQKTLTDQQKESLKVYGEAVKNDPTLLEPGGAAKRDTLVKDLGLEGIMRVKGLNPGANTDQLGPRGLGTPSSAGAAAPAAAPVPAYSDMSLPITNRITAAHIRDKATGNNYEVNRLRQEASAIVPELRSQIATLKNSMSQGTPQQKASMEVRIGDLEKELTAYSGLLPQPTGLR